HVSVAIFLCSLFFFSSRRRHTRSKRDWSSDVCSSDLMPIMMSYSPGKVSCVAGKRYLIGPMVFFRLGKELSVASLSLGDLQYVLKFLNSHQKFITVDREILQVICLD